MQPLHIATPLWEAPQLSSRAGTQVLLKMEAFQPAASFKIRGMGRICQTHAAAGAGALLCASGGNAGLAVAYAGRKLGLPTTVVVPKRTSAWARAMIRAEGAHVEEHGDAWDEAHLYALALAAQTGAAYAHPFDDPLAWAGHATLVEELAAAGVHPGAVIVSVGGGGLLCGVVEGLMAQAWNDVPVLAVETAGAASYMAAFQAGAPVRLEAITSIAVTLSARQVAVRSIELARSHPIIPHLVSDRAAVDACRNFADQHRVLVEPACGAALAALDNLPQELRGRDPLLVVVCGGAGVSLELLRQWDAQLAA
ncbi:MAG: pyridoxal-phosphate dependent enzyme [Oscillochloris sp.]|nr:pyridoxal-phosphate dependent enzyme [Oscillochloris sp.]